MKKKIHPDYGSSTIICACGNKVETGSTVSELKVEICSACHPFYTGQKKIVDSAGRVDRFKKRMEKSQSIIAEEETKKELKKKKKKKKPVGVYPREAGTKATAVEEKKAE